MANEVLKKLWIYLTVEFIIKSLLVAENDIILVVCNRLSKMVHFVIITKEISVESLAMLFGDNMWKLYGLLESVILDRRPQFATELTKELNQMLGIEKRLSMAFHPQTNRQIKYMNQKLEQYLRFFVDHRKKNWLEWLAIAGRQKTMELVTRNYQWPGVTRDIERYIEGCNIYQRIKNRTEEVAGKLKLSEVLEKLWTHLMVDFIMKRLSHEEIR